MMPTVPSGTNLCMTPEQEIGSAGPSRAPRLLVACASVVTGDCHGGTLEQEAQVDALLGSELPPVGRTLLVHES